MPVEDEKWIITRRNFLRLGRASLFVSGLYSLYPLSKYLMGGTRLENKLRVSKSEFIITTQWQRVKDTRIWLRRVSGRIESISGTCTHLGCQVSFDHKLEEWICPCHGSRYAKDGQVLHGPAIKPLQKLDVQEAEDTYIVKIGVS